MPNDSILRIMYNNSSSQNSFWSFNPATSDDDISVVQLSKSMGTKLLEISPEALDRGLRPGELRRLSKSPPVLELMINRVADAAESCNIVGRFPGQDNAEGYIVLTAHYDHIGYTNMEIFPVSNDNASGVAVLMEVARMLKEAKKIRDAAQT